MAYETVGNFRVIGPEEAPSWWQPVPANGFVRCIAEGISVGADHRFGLGTQTVPPGGFVREHSHDRHEEVLHFVAGHGKAVIDGGAEEHNLSPGTTLFIGRWRKHKFVNTGTEDLSWVWLILPEGLEAFFPAIGRPRTPGEPAPAPFPRPADVLEIERRTVFAGGDPT